MLSTNSARLLVAALLAGLIAGNGYGASVGDVEKELLADIKQSRERLLQAEKQQLRERKKLSQQLQAAEQKVAQLSDKAAVMQRLADEKTLALDSIEERLKNWKEQEAYQLYALADYLGDRLSADQKHPLPDMLDSLQQSIQALEKNLEPAWREQQIIGADGQLEQASVLQLGPVMWAYQGEHNSGGLLAAGEIPTMALPLGADITEQWQQTLQHNRGTLHFDPSLGRAIKMAQQRETLIQHVDKGGLWALPILAFGLTALVLRVAEKLAIIQAAEMD